MDAQTLSDQFRDKRKLYIDFTKSLGQLLKDLLGSVSIDVMPLETRTKTHSSFNDKVAREDKLGKYHCLEDITDLCGIRIITYLREEQTRISTLILDNFDVDAANSIDKEEDLPDDRFGYRSIHFVVTLKEDRTKLPEFARFKGLKAEIQVGTVLQHAWAAIDWKFRYKSEEEAPKELRRRLFRISALLEAADDDFSFLSEKLVQVRKEYTSKVSNRDLNLPVDVESMEQYLIQGEVVEAIVRAASSAGITEMPLTPLGLSRISKVAQVLGLRKISDLDIALNGVRPYFEEIFRIYEAARLKMLTGFPSSTEREMARSALVRTVLIATLQDRDDVEPAVKCVSDSKAPLNLYLAVFDAMKAKIV